jgi:hypothetical protein
MAGNVLSTASEQFNIGGIQFGSTANNNSNDGDIIKVICTVAQPATVTTKNSNSNAVLTMTNANHGIVNTQVVDVYFSGGQRRSLIANSVNGNSVTLAGGYGTNLPVANTTLNVGPVTTIPKNITGANVVGIAFQVPQGGTGTAEGMFSLQTSVPAEIIGQDILAGQDYIWYNGNGITNPVTGNTIATVALSTNNVTSNQALNGALQYS